MQKYFKYLVLMLALLLNGCVAAVIAGSLATGIVLYDKRSLSVMETDIGICYKINQAIQVDPRFHGTRIVVVCFNRNVLLIGQTPAATLKIMSEKIADKQPLVMRVYNEIHISAPISLNQKTKDTLITSQVRSGLLTKHGLESGSIRIITENGIVYLMGKVNSEQANLAVDVARQIDEVQQVVKVFQNTP